MSMVDFIYKITETFQDSLIKKSSQHSLVIMRSGTINDPHIPNVGNFRYRAFYRHFTIYVYLRGYSSDACGDIVS